MLKIESSGANPWVQLVDKRLHPLAGTYNDTRIRSIWVCGLGF